VLPSITLHKALIQKCLVAIVLVKSVKSLPHSGLSLRAGCQLIPTAEIWLKFQTKTKTWGNFQAAKARIAAWLLSELPVALSVFLNHEEKIKFSKCD